MKTQPFIWVSLGVNLALAGGIVLSLQKPAAPAPEQPPPPPPAATTVETQRPGASPAPHGMPFHWNQIESEDLKAYRDNLRAIGCPDVTVREIIRAVINERFGPRREAILAGFQSRFWQFLIRGDLGKRQSVARTEWGRALDDLRAERQKLIAEVLGHDYLSTEAELQSRRASLEQQRSWLPADKRDRLMALEEQYQQRLADWAASVGSRPDRSPTAEDSAHMQALQKDFADAEKQLLTPEELKELRLRESADADWAGALPGFEPTEDEWRSVTQLRSDFDQAQSDLASADLTDPDRQAKQKQLEDKLAADTQEALGADRFAQYELAGNAQFQEVRSITQRYGLPDSIATEAYQVQQAAVAQADQVRNNADLTPEDRQSLLAAIQDQTQRTLAQTLGQQVFSTYQDYSGSWLQDLTHAP